MSGKGSGRDWSRDEWDPARRMRFYQDPENARYVYQNGMYLTRDGVEHWPGASASSGTGRRRPVDDDTSRPSAGRDWTRESLDTTRGLRYYTDAENGRYIYQNGMYVTRDGVEHWPSPATTSSGTARHRPVDSGIAEPSSEQLFRAKPADFFKRFRVFAIRPSREAGASNTVLSNLDIEAGQYGPSIFVSNVLRFVIVAEGQEGESSCLALPISSYHGQGVAANGVVKSNHGIIHTGNRAPKPTAAESPVRGERGMVPNAIRVSRSDPTEKLHPMSRVDYGSPRRIPFDEPVHEIGVVHPEYEAQLISQFNFVQEQRRGQSAPITIPARARGDSEAGPSRSLGLSSSQTPRAVLGSPQTQQARLVGSPLQASSPSVIGPQLRRNYDRLEAQGMQHRDILLQLTQTYRATHPNDLSWQEASAHVQDLLRIYP